MSGNNYKNYISNMVAEYGEHWIVTLRPEDIQRNGKRIFREMILGKMNYSEVGKYFLDGKFLTNLIIKANNELEINTLYLNAVGMMMQVNPTYPNIASVYTHLQTLCLIYQVLSNKLENVSNTGDIGCLADTPALLYAYRSHLD